RAFPYFGVLNILGMKFGRDANRRTAAISCGTPIDLEQENFRLFHIWRSRIRWATGRGNRRCSFEIGPIMEPFTVVCYSSKHAFGTSRIRIKLQRHLATFIRLRGELAVGED